MSKLPIKLSPQTIQDSFNGKSKDHFDLYALYKKYEHIFTPAEKNTLLNSYKHVGESMASDIDFLVALECTEADRIEFN